MKARFLVGLALAFWPAAAPAAVVVQVERGDATPGQVVTLDVFASNPDASENERLNAFTIALDAPTFGGPRAPRFILPAANPDGTISFAESSAAHPYVFGAYPGNGPVDPAGLSDENTILLSAALGGTGQEANISDTLNGFAQVKVFIPVDFIPGFYPITVDPTFLSLGGAGTSIVAVGGVGGVVWVPEPASVALLAPLGALALRRSRPRPCA